MSDFALFSWIDATKIVRIRLRYFIIGSNQIVSTMLRFLFTRKIKNERFHNKRKNASGQKWKVFFKILKPISLLPTTWWSNQCSNNLSKVNSDGFVSLNERFGWHMLGGHDYTNQAQKITPRTRVMSVWVGCWPNFLLSIGKHNTSFKAQDLVSCQKCALIWATTKFIAVGKNNLFLG